MRPRTASLIKCSRLGVPGRCAGSIEDLAVHPPRSDEATGRTSTVASKPLERVAVQFGDGDSMEQNRFGEDTQTARALHRWLCPLRLRLQALREQVHPVCSFVFAPTP